LGELFEGLTGQQETRIRNLGHTESYPPNAIICSEGAEARNIYLVEEGEVTVESGPRNGIRIPISVVSAGEAFAWSALVPPFRLTATVTASRPTKVLAIARKELLETMRTDPEMAIGLMQNVARIAASRLNNLQQELAAVLSK
jgi:CRP-like cAMP-binding protein